MGAHLHTTNTNTSKRALFDITFLTVCFSIFPVNNVFEAAERRLQFGLPAGRCQYYKQPPVELCAILNFDPSVTFTGVATCVKTSCTLSVKCV